MNHYTDSFAVVKIFKILDRFHRFLHYFRTSQAPDEEPKQEPQPESSAPPEEEGEDSEDESSAAVALYRSGRYSPPLLTPEALEPGTLLTDVTDDEQRIAFLRHALHAAAANKHAKDASQALVTLVSLLHCLYDVVN